MPRPPLVVVGTGRSGTKYMSELLKANGLRCGHESYYSPLKFAAESQDQFLDAESSWLAVPYLEQDSSATRILHVTRHPVKVVRSLLEIRFFHPDATGSPFVEFTRRNSRVFEWEDPARRAVEFWLEWNRRCLDLAHVSTKIENLDYFRISKLAKRAIFPKDISVFTNHQPDSLHAGRVADSTSDSAILEYLDGRQSDFGY